MRFVYYIIHSFFYLVSLLPFRVLYAISDFLYVIVYLLVGYRKKIVKKNITTSFPDKTVKECAYIERSFYHFLCDYFMETIKLLSISKASMMKHIEFRNVEDMEQCFDRGQNCAAVLGHYCNWEWLSASGLYFKRYPNAVMGLIYHPLYNENFDKLFIDLRQSLGGVCVPKKDILRYLINYRSEKKNYLFGYISDQAPKWENIHLWLNFMNHDTPVFTGAERIMRKMNDAVFYVDMQRMNRGHYVCTFRLITDKLESLPENELTKRFFAMLENSIKKDPRYYLWSHNRWKRTHEEFNKRFIIDHGHVISRK